MIIEMKDLEEYVCQCKYIMCFYKAQDKQIKIVFANQPMQMLNYENNTDRNSDFDRLKLAMKNMYDLENR